jgi:hypothetical protein
MKGNLFGAGKYMFAGATMAPVVNHIQINENVKNECNAEVKGEEEV